MDSSRCLPGHPSHVSAGIRSRAFTGASGYIAILSLAGLPSAEIRAIALVLNVLRPPPRERALAGASLGLLAGLTGTGGGIVLTPWMILRPWLLARQAAAVSVGFILVNSIAGTSGLAPVAAVVLLLAAWKLLSIGAWLSSIT